MQDQQGKSAFWPGRWGASRFPGSLALKTGLALGLIALGDTLLFQHKLSGGYFGVLLLAMLAALVAGRPAVRRDRRAWIAITLAAAYALATIFDTSLLSWTMFWIAAGMAAMLPATAAFDDGWRWFQRLFFQAVIAPFGPIIDLIRLQKIRRKRPLPGRGVRQSFRVLALPLIGSGVILALFAAANPILDRLFSSFRLAALDITDVARLMLWGGLFVLVWSLLRPRLPQKILPTLDGSGDLPLPGVSVGSVLLSLIAFNLIFALQNAMDIAWLWGLTPLPEGMTLAEYAHRGAYPLIATALLAAGFVLVTLRPGSTTASVPAIRRLVVLWIGQNIVLVASSMLRTIDYIDAYSLTRLRISALAWMVLVCIGLLLICWRMLRGRSAGWLINRNLAAAGTLLTVCCFVDLGAMAAQWNVRHGREAGGSGAAIDLCYLNHLGGSALIPLIELEQRSKSGAFRDRVQITRRRVQAELAGQVADGGWSWRNARRLEQAQRLGAKISKPIYGFDCHGRAVPPPPMIVPEQPDGVEPATEEPQAVVPAPVLAPTAAPAAPLTGIAEQ